MGRSTKYPRQGQGIPLNQGCSPAAAPTEGPPQMPNKQLLPPSAASSNGRHLPTVRYSVPRQQTEAGALPHAEGKDTRQPSAGDSAMLAAGTRGVSPPRRLCRCTRPMQGCRLPASVWRTCVPTVSHKQVFGSQRRAHQVQCSSWQLPSLVN